MPLLQYHILQETVLTDELEVVDPHFPQTMLLNQSWTNVTGGQCVTLMRQDEEEIFLVSGLDSRSMIDYQNRDIHFFEGVIQPIDTLLVPPLQLSETIRARVPSMSAFLGALYKTGLADEVMEAKDVTIFAPDNQAFQRTFGALNELSMDELRNVLAYHIVPDRVLYSHGLERRGQLATRATTGDGEAEQINLTISSAGNHLYIDSSAIQDPDIMIANGAVHMHVFPNSFTTFLSQRDQQLTTLHLPHAVSETCSTLWNPMLSLNQDARSNHPSLSCKAMLPPVEHFQHHSSLTYPALSTVLRPRRPRRHLNRRHIGQR